MSTDTFYESIKLGMKDLSGTMVNKYIVFKSLSRLILEKYTPDRLKATTIFFFKVNEAINRAAVQDRIRRSISTPRYICREALNSRLKV